MNKDWYFFFLRELSDKWLYVFQRACKELLAYYRQMNKFEKSIVYYLILKHWYNYK